MLEAPSGLQLDLRPRFERGWNLAQLLAILVGAVILIAAVSGLLGGGALSGATAKAQGAPVAVRYDRLGRAFAPTKLEIKVQGPLPPGPLKVQFSPDLIRRMQIQHILPRPDSMSSSADGVTFTFAAAPSGSTIRFEVQPLDFGPFQGTVRVAGASASLRGFVFP